MPSKKIVLMNSLTQTSVSDTLFVIAHHLLYTTWDY